MLVVAPHARRRFVAAEPLAAPRRVPRAQARIRSRTRSATLCRYVLVACAMLNLALYGVGLLSVPPSPVALADSTEDTFRQALVPSPSFLRQRRPPECYQIDIGYGLVDPCRY